MFINSKDVPFAVLYIWSLYYLLRFLDRLPGPTIRDSLKLGLAAGLTMGIRVGGLVLLPYCYLFTAANLVYFLVARKETSPALGRTLKRILLALSVITFTAYSIMLVFWPYGMSKPLVRPFYTLQQFSSLPAAPSPIGYIPGYLAVKLPELVILIVGLGVCLGAKHLAQSDFRKAFPNLLSHGLLVFSVTFPVAYVMLKRTFLYDEIRHFLFIIPPLFCIVGITFHHVLVWIRKSRLATFVTVPLLASYFVVHIGVMVRLHPYEYIYYNRFAGGVKGAYDKGYEADYWVTAYRELVQSLEMALRERDGKNFEQMRYRIFMGPAPWSATYYFPAQFVSTNDPLQADFYLSTTRYLAHSRYAGKEVVGVRRFGVPLAIAKLLNQGKAD